MTFLLTNDDGIDAPGLAALAEAVAGLGPSVWVAPCGPQSGCSHRVTTDAPLRIVPHTGGRWAIAGTPADCVRLGLKRLAPQLTWVLAGINHGGNLGADVHHSGTVAAVREAALHGVPGIALSHYRKRGLDIDWQRATRWLRPIVQELLAKAWTPGTFWNINLPHLPADALDPEVVVCPLDRSPLPINYREENGHWHYDANYHERPRLPGTDVDVCFGGRIAVTLLSI
ncbi:MAG: 5'/3'-nucleotidase SurE [Gemmataceae bacterium]|nr:5'/3'-nucleotidase SurE [Gemmataceae bacterium]